MALALFNASFTSPNLFETSILNSGLNQVLFLCIRSLLLQLKYLNLKKDGPTFAEPQLPSRRPKESKARLRPPGQRRSRGIKGRAAQLLLPRSRRTDQEARPVRRQQQPAEEPHEQRWQDAHQERLLAPC